jgi:hypothetical protein
MIYKRNQVEEAIARLMGQPQPSQELRTRLKRLLDSDRDSVRKLRSEGKKSAPFAFYSDEQQGKGVEVGFAEYGAFALLTSLRLLQHGWPQGFAVKILQDVKEVLEKEHARILRQDSSKLFDPEKIRNNARPGELAIDNTDAVFLLIFSKGGINDEPSGTVCRGSKKVFALINDAGAAPWTFHELVTSAHRLRGQLAEIPPRKRGRTG